MNLSSLKKISDTHKGSIGIHSSRQSPKGHENFPKKDIQKGQNVEFETFFLDSQKYFFKEIQNVQKNT